VIYGYANEIITMTIYIFYLHLRDLASAFNALIPQLTQLSETQNVYSAVFICCNTCHVWTESLNSTKSSSLNNNQRVYGEYLPTGRPLIGLQCTDASCMTARALIRLQQFLESCTYKISTAGSCR